MVLSFRYTCIDYNCTSRNKVLSYLSRGTEKDTKSGLYIMYMKGVHNEQEMNLAGLIYISQ